MKISVIIPAYNAEKFLARAVESLINTRYPNLEIIIVDDGSEDATRNVADGLGKKYPGCVRVFTHPDNVNRGVSASRNLGIMKSNGELICFLDADDYVFPHRFKAAVPRLQKDKSIDAVYELTQMAFETDQARSAWCDKRELFGLGEDIPSDKLLTVLLRGQTWHTGGILCRRTLFDRTGFFSEKFHFAEDCHLWFRMAAVGRIVAGEMLRPISAYCRHSNNTYQYSLDRRVDMVKVMIDAFKWTIYHNAADSVKNIFSDGIKDYILNGIIVARENKRFDIAWGIIRSVLAGGFTQILKNVSLFRQVSWLCWETLFS